jgi:hypothetical protein
LGAQIPNTDMSMAMSKGSTKRANFTRGERAMYLKGRAEVATHRNTSPKV